MQRTAPVLPIIPGTPERRSHDYIGTAPAVHRWLLAHPVVQLHFTPTYSSWISLAGRWFAELQRRCLDGGGFCAPLRVHHRAVGLD